jgi:hypothetical protein
MFVNLLYRFDVTEQDIQYMRIILMTMALTAVGLLL